jgi:hypothetical protein
MQCESWDHCCVRRCWLRNEQSEGKRVDISRLAAFELCSQPPRTQSQCIRVSVRVSRSCSCVAPFCICPPPRHCLPPQWCGADECRPLFRPPSRRPLSRPIRSARLSRTQRILTAHSALLKQNSDIGRRGLRVNASHCNCIALGCAVMRSAHRRSRDRHPIAAH